VNLRPSDHFSWEEFTCHDGTEVPLEYRGNVERLCQDVLEPLRSRYGGALIPVCGYRTVYHNFAVGGAPHSQHLTASAADIRPVEMVLLPRLRAVVEEMLAEGALGALGGLGWYPGQWVHVDIRPRANGAVVRWIGKGMGSEDNTGARPTQEIL